MLLYVAHYAVATAPACGCGSWALMFHCRLPRQISPLPTTPSQTEVCSTISMGESIEPSSFHNPTLLANKHVVQIFRFSLSAAADCLADGSGEHRTSPFNGIERSLCRAVVPKTKSPCASSTTCPTACLCTMRRDACEGTSANQAFLKGRTVAIRKGIAVTKKILWGISFRRKINEINVHPKFSSTWFADLSIVSSSFYFLRSI